MANITAKEEIFNFVYDMAFRDATMRNAFPKGKQSDANYKRIKMEIYKKSKSIIKAYIDDILDDKKMPDVYEYLEKINKSCDNKRFSFGNAQKLLNMTAKYMYISCYANELIREKFKECHCPMDSYMIKHVYKMIKDKSNIDKYKPYEKSKGISEWDSIAWSKIKWGVLDGKEGICVYKRFQEIIKELAGEDCYPIEYDFINWKEIS